MAASNTRFTQNSLGQSKNPIDSASRYLPRQRREFMTLLGGSAGPWLCGRASALITLWDISIHLCAPKRLPSKSVHENKTAQSS